ncbi:MAG: hypothetical protein FWC13_04380 [Oscillospiraceae bacterium]|nr:hypothetical protein [Oscillospiraceae bacterium]
MSTDIKKPTKKVLDVKQMLFYYLAITKIFYWIGTLNAIENLGEFGNVFINRMINQDIMTIIILVAMSVLDYYLFRGKDSGDFIATIKLYILGFIIFIALIIGYTLLLGLFITVNINDWPMFILDWAIIFVVICVGLYIKDRFKAKEAEKYLPNADTSEGKLAMLKTLCEKGVLTQAEFDEKSANLAVDA